VSDLLTIQLALAERDQAASQEVEFVGGPRDGQRVASRAMAPAMVRGRSGAGFYRRSVRCADDGALRYVWQEEEVTN
jgi:hypothetical protein